MEFSEMIGSMETVEKEKPEPFELNSLEFFVLALSYFEGEACGQLSSDEQSPASTVESLISRFEINALKHIILKEHHNDVSKLLDESTSTPDRPSGPLLEEMFDDDSLSTMMVNSIGVNNNIIGTNSSLTSEFQVPDPNLRWLKNIITSKRTNKERFELDKKDPNTNIKKKLLKQLPNFQIIKDLIYLVDEDKFKNKRSR